MSTEKETFLQQLRTDTNYPYLRKFNDVIYGLFSGFTVFYTIFIIITWIVYLNGPGHNVFAERDLVGFVVGILIVCGCIIILMFIKVFYQIITLFIDVADSILQSSNELKNVVINSKNYGSYIKMRGLLPHIDLTQQRTKEK